MTMFYARKSIQLADDLHEFAEELVRAGRYASVTEVVRAALEEMKLATLRQALDLGLAELDAGLGVETTPDDLVAQAATEAGVEP